MIKVRDEMSIGLSLASLTRIFVIDHIMKQTESLRESDVSLLSCLRLQKLARITGE
jgi:hypothetical protein